MRPLPPPTLATLNPPIAGYRYFDHPSARLRAGAGEATASNRWLLAECALLAYDAEAAIRAAFEGRARRVEVLMQS